MFNQYSRRSVGTINRQMAALGDNVRNINNYFTTGYRSKTTRFVDEMGTVRTESRNNFAPGTPRKTSRPLDFAIDGIGFFEIMMPDGTYAYTRDGSFKLGAHGELLSAQGYPVSNTREYGDNEMGQDYDAMINSGGNIKMGLEMQSIKVPTGSLIQADEEGNIQTEDGQFLGKLSVVTFPNVDGLVDIGGNLFLPGHDTGTPEPVETGYFNGQTKIKQGHLESSNTSIVENMEKAVQLNTSIKSQMKVLKLLDGMQETLNSTITRNI